MKRVFWLVLAVCLTGLAHGGSYAWAVVAQNEQRVCTADVRWQGVVLGATDVQAIYTNVVCDGRFVSANTDGIQGAFGPTHTEDPGPNVLELDVQNLIAVGPVFTAAVGNANEGLTGAFAASPSALTASFVSKTTTSDGYEMVRKGEHAPAGTCGTGCYLTTLRAVHTLEKVS
jgi:hypothetical protein